MLYLARRLLLYTIYKFESQSGGGSKSAAFILYPFDWKLHPPCHFSSWIQKKNILVSFCVIIPPAFCQYSSLTASKALDLVQGTDSLRPFEKGLANIIQGLSL